MDTMNIVRWVIFFIGVLVCFLYVNSAILHMVTKNKPEDKRYEAPSHWYAIVGLLIILVTLILPFVVPTK